MPKLPPPRAPRDIVAERRRAARRALEPKLDNVANMDKAHDVRRLRECIHCHGIGDREQMLCTPSGALSHTRCFLEVYGFDAVLDLPVGLSGKFRMCDLTDAQMIQLLRQRRKRA